MAFQWPVGKLDLVNRALAVTGNNLVAVVEDGSDEWNICSPAYEDALAVMTEDHGWGQATKIVAALTANATAPTNTAWDTRYLLPSDLVHLIWVRVNQDTTDPTSQTLGQPTLYDIEEGFLVLNARGGPPPDPSQTPGTVSIKYISTGMDAVQGTPRFVRALQAFVMSGIYRGLHGDKEEADRLFGQAEILAQFARTRYDQQKPKRTLWNSRVTAARRIRHPYPPTGNNDWGGTGSAG